MIIFEMYSNKKLIASKNVSHFSNTLIASKDVSHFSRNDWSFSKRLKEANSEENHVFSIDSSHAFSIDSWNASVVVSTENVQIRFESMNQNSTNQESMFESISKSKRTRKKMNSFSADFVSMNTRSRARKSIYAITLIIVNHFISYYATFSIELQRSNQSSISKLHKDDLSSESRYWKQMLTHCFFKKFHFAATKEMIELKKRRTFQLMKKASNQDRTFLIWAFKYKFNADKYVKKFKIRFVSKMICKWLIKTRMRQHLLQKRFVL